MKKLILTLFICAFAGIAMAQDEETRPLEPFRGVSVGESIEVYLKKGNNHEALIETSNVSTDKVLTDVRNGTLRIEMARGSFRMTKVTVYLEYRELEEISVSSSADVYGEGVVKGEELSISVSSSGFAALTVDVNELEIDISSSGKLELQGSANTANIDVSSSGKLMAFDLNMEIVQIEANSSGKAEINVSKELRAEANSSGKVAYAGNPERIFVDSNSGGRVNSVN